MDHKKTRIKLSVRYRRDYLLELARELIKPHAIKKLSCKQLPKRIVDSITLFALKESNQVLPNEEERPATSRICSLCTRKEDKRTRNICTISQEPVCNAHCNIKNNNMY